MPLHKKIRDFLELDTSGIVSDLVTNTYKVNQPDHNNMQTNAWNSSIENFKKILLYVKSTGLDIILEQDLPLANERIDAVLIGKNPSGKLTAIIIEFKGWTFINPVSDEIVQCDLGRSMNPEYQLENYLGKLRFCNTCSEFYDFIGVINLYNLPKVQCNLEFKNKTYFNGENLSFGSFINSLNLTEASEDEIDLFINGKYTQNNKLFDAIKNNAESIFNASRTVLAASGFGLSEEQINLLSEIENDINQGNKVTYLVQGSPGSGKTLLAISILLSSLSKNKNSILAFMNNRLIACVRDVFNNLKNAQGNQLATGGVIKFYSTGNIDRPGVAENGYNGRHDVVIYDEAQRMNAENIRNSYMRGNVNVIFFDENQRLNYNERGTLSNFKNIADGNGIEIRECFLKGSYRVEGGMEYNVWLEKFITDPAEFKEQSSWNQIYDLRIFNSFDEVIQVLKDKRDEIVGTKVALAASFTESNGNMGDLLATNNIRIGRDLLTDMIHYNQMIYNIYWLMKPEEYVSFWIDGECNDLTKCASIYGAQGFEADYVSFVWGRDLVIRNGTWELGSHCEDFPAVARPSTLKYIMKQEANIDRGKYDIAMTLLKNRLRIFLSRGIKGTYVFCEDDETREFLINE